MFSKQVLAVVNFFLCLLQFQEAFSSADGRIKLVHSMEGIVRGSQQVMLFLHTQMIDLEGCICINVCYFSFILSVYSFIECAFCDYES